MGKTLLDADEPHRFGSSGFALATRSDLPKRPIEQNPLVVTVEEHFDLSRAAAAFGTPTSHRVYFAIAATMPWSTVVAVVDAARTAGLTQPAFLFEDPATLTPPPRSPMDDKLDELAKDGKVDATAFAKLISEQLAACPAADKAFFRGAGAGDAAMIDGLSKALVECKCNVDIPSLRSTLWRLMWDPHPARVLALESSTAGATISLPATTPWSEAQKSLKSDMKSAKLVVGH
jgi:hypothetical protein